MSQLYKLKFINLKKPYQIEAESDLKIDELIKTGIQNLNLDFNPKPIIVSNPQIKLNSPLDDLSEMNNNLTVKLENMITIEFHSEDFKTNNKKKVNIFDTIIELNTQIYNIFGLQNHYQVNYTTEGRQLNPLKTLYKMGIKEGQIIDYRIICTFFIFYQDKRIFFQCKINDKLQLIKETIRKQLYIHEEFHLGFQNKYLDPAHEYAVYSIPQNSLLTLTIKDSLNVRVQFMNSIHNLNVHQTGTVDDLIKYFTNDYRYILKNGDTKLAPTQTFQHLNLQDNVLLTLDEDQEDPEQVFSQILAQITIKFNVKQFIEIQEERVFVGNKFQTLINQIKARLKLQEVRLYQNNQLIDPNTEIKEIHQQQEFFVDFT